MINKKLIFLSGLVILLVSNIFITTELDAKKKIKKKPGVKYIDINVVKGIRKEVYLDFPVGKTWGPSDTSVFSVTLEKKKDFPNLAKDRLVFRGATSRKFASTDLWVYDENDVLKIVYNVTVTDYNIKRILGFLKKELKNVEGLKMYIREDKIVLDGEILLPDDIARINQVISGFEPVFKVQYKLSPTLFKVVAEKMEKEIGLPDVHVEVVNEKFFLKGIVDDNVQLKYVVDKATAYLPKYFFEPFVNLQGAGGELKEPNTDESLINYDFLKIKQAIEKPKKLIKIVVYFVEITKGFEDNFGFSWSPTIDTSASNATMTWSSKKTDDKGNAIEPLATTITGIIQNFIPKLKNAVDTKRGRVIQTSAITIENEASGAINKTTEYPYIITTADQIQTKTFKVGIQVKLTPKIMGLVDSSQDISLAPVEVEVSQLVSMSANGLPITTSNNMSTYINLKSGDTAAIGGIVQNTGYKGFKEGSDEKNVIIDLTRSKSFQRNKTQFVMFVTPEIVVSAAEASKKAKEAFNVK